MLGQIKDAGIECRINLKWPFNAQQNVWAQVWKHTVMIPEDVQSSKLEITCTENISVTCEGKEGLRWDISVKVKELITLTCKGCMEERRQGD